jgi:hypothetical protein
VPSLLANQTVRIPTALRAPQSPKIANLVYLLDEIEGSKTFSHSLGWLRTLRSISTLDMLRLHDRTLDMPLYTYVVSYQGKSHVSQARRSNYQGFGDWATELPQGLLSDSQKKEVIKQMYAGFETIPNRVNAWRKEFPLGNSVFTIIAVETKS